MDIQKISVEIAYCDQPTAQDLQFLREQGVRTLVNVRLPGELLFDEEGIAEQRGLRYVHIPIAQREWSTDHFVELDKALERYHALPAVVHSAEGARAGILALAWYACHHGWAVDEVLRYARTLGLDMPAAALDWLRAKGAREAAVEELRTK